MGTRVGNAVQSAPDGSVPCAVFKGVLTLYLTCAFWVDFLRLPCESTPANFCRKRSKIISQNLPVRMCQRILISGCVVETQLIRISVVVLFPCQAFHIAVNVAAVQNPCQIFVFSGKVVDLFLHLCQFRFLLRNIGLDGYHTDGTSDNCDNYCGPADDPKDPA